MSLFVAIWYFSLSQLLAGLLPMAILSCDTACFIPVRSRGVFVESTESPPVSGPPPPRLMPKIDANRMDAGLSSFSAAAALEVQANLLVRLSGATALVLLGVSAAASDGFSGRLLILLTFSTRAGHSHCSVLQWTHTSFVSNWRQSFGTNVRVGRMIDPMKVGVVGWRSAFRKNRNTN